MKCKQISAQTEYNLNLLVGVAGAYSRSPLIIAATVENVNDAKIIEGEM